MLLLLLLSLVSALLLQMLSLMPEWGSVNCSVVTNVIVNFLPAFTIKTVFLIIRILFARFPCISPPLAQCVSSWIVIFRDVAPKEILGHRWLTQ